jgi:predicted GIY-YIG superfamily endonuclease
MPLPLRAALALTYTMSSLSLLLQLKSFREHRSLIDSIPIYCVFGDTVMRSIAQDRPITMQALQGIRGLTPEKTRQYGQDILRLVQASLPPLPSLDPPSFLKKYPARRRAPVAGGFRRRTLLQKMVPPLRAPSNKHPRILVSDPLPMNATFLRPSPATADNEDQIYILELTLGRVYVGKTSDLRRRVSQHLSARGSAFTQSFPPTGTLLPRLGRVSGSAEAAERDETLRYMFLRGIALVRGWKYTRVHMTEPEERDAEENIRELFDLCRRCGRPGHFVSQCKCKVDRLGRPLMDRGLGAS